MSDVRIEKDSMGEIEVPKDRYYGAQTARSKMNFPIGDDCMPLEVVRAFGVLKKAAALTNRELGNLEPEICDLIVKAADEVIAGNCSVVPYGYTVEPVMSVVVGPESADADMSRSPLGVSTCARPNAHVISEQSAACQFG